MANIARFQVRFEVDGQGQVKAELESINAEARKSASAAKDAGKEWEEFGQKLGTSMKWAGATAVAGIGLIVHNTIKAQQEFAQLEAVVKSTSGAAGFSLGQLSSMAEKVAAASMFSTGEVVSAETRLLSYSNIVGETFPRALQTAIDQATRLNISVEQSAEIVGRALGEPTKAMTALAQQGFSFSEEQKKLIKQLEKTGKTAEAQALILDMLEESYGGAAQAARDTLGGSLSELTDVLSDLMTGDAGGEGLKGAQLATEDLIKTLNDPNVRSGFAGMAEGAIAATSALITFVGWANQAFEAGTRWATMQLGGTKQVTDLQQIRHELGELQSEKGARDSGEADSFLGRLGRTWSGAGNLVGLNTTSGMSDADLSQRIAELKRLERDSIDLFGDPNEQRVLGLDGSSIPESYLRPKSPPPPKLDPEKKKKKALTEEEREAKRLQDRYQDLLLTYAREEYLHGKTGEAARVRFEIEHGELAKLLPEQQKLLQAQAEASDARDREAEQKAEGARLTEEMRTPQQALNAEVDRYRTLLDAGAISQETHNLAVAGAEDAFARAEKAAQKFATVEDLMQDFGDSMPYALGDTLFDAFSGNADRIEDRWKQMLLRLAADIASSELIEWINGMGSDKADGASSGGGWWSAITSAVGAWLGGGSSSPSASASYVGPRAAGGGMQAGKLYEVAENGKPEVIEQNGRRFLVAGAGGNVVPAEYAAMGGGGMGFGGIPSIEFNVTNNAADVAEVGQPSITMEMGKMLVNLAVSKVNQGLARKGSPTNKAMRAGLASGGQYG